MPDESRIPPADAEILAALRRGDESAFDGLVRLYRKDVYRLAYRLTGDHGEADDLAQETFVRAWQAIGGFRGEAALRTWLLRIAANLGLNVIHSARVAKREAVDIEEAAPPSAATAESSLIEEERRRRLLPAIDGLPPKQRATLILRVDGELKFREIAGIMGCTTGTAKANFFHAVAALRRALKGLV